MRRVPVLPVVVIACALAPRVAAQGAWPSTYVGTLGARRIVMEFVRDSADARAVRGRWLDRAVGVDHAVAGRWGGDTLLLEETARPVREDDPREPSEPASPQVARWLLLRAGGSLAGSRWATGDGARLPVRLDPARNMAAAGAADTALIADGYVPWRGHETYEAFRADAPLVAGPVTRRGTVAWRTLTDPRSGVAMPRLVAHPDAAAMARANAALDALRRREIGSAFACAAELAAGGAIAGTTPLVPDRDNQFTYTIVHVDARLLTLQQAGSVFCGGAHPANVWTVTMLDLVHGRVVTGDDLVRPSRRGALARLVLQRLHGRRRPGAPDEGADCSLFVDDERGRPQLVEYVRWAVIDGRFSVIQTDHPHAMSPCNDRYGTIPRTALRDIVHSWVLGSLRR
jgi:hypothetical protein